MEPTLYIFINKSLGMSIGKTASQAAHAAALSMADNHEEDNELWKQSLRKTVIILEAENELQIRTISDYLRQRGVASEFIIDEGANEVPFMSVTALAVPFMDKDFGNKLMSVFNLYHGTRPQHAAQNLISEIESLKV